MKNVLIILFLVVFEKTFSQYTATFKTGNEAVVTKYEVQQSADTLNWSTIASILPGKSSYTYTLPLVTKYYRIHASGLKDFYTRAIKLIVDVVYSSTITNAKFTTSWWYDNLKWTTTNESNVSYYLISKSTSSTTIKVTAKGNSNYSYSISRWGKKPVYSIRAVYTNATVGTQINFQ